MITSFKDIERQMIKRELLRREGKIPLEDAIYEFLEAFGLLASDPAQRRAEVPATEPIVTLAECSEWLTAVLAAKEQFAQWLRKCVPQRSIEFGFSSAETVERVLPLGTIPALFVRPQGNTEEGRVDVLALPRLSPDGVLNIVASIPRKFCTAGKPLEVVLVAAPSARPVGESVHLTASAEPKSLCFRLPADLGMAWREIATLEWENLPLRFVVHGSAPYKPDEPELVAAGVLRKQHFRLPNDLRLFAEIGLPLAPERLLLGD